MRKLLYTFLFVATSLITVLILRAFLPKFAGMLLFFFVFLLLDGYLWLSVAPAIRKLKPAARATATILFWLPLATLPCMIITGLFVPFLDWNVPARTYLQSILLMFLLLKLFPMLALVATDLIRAIKFAAFMLIPEWRAGIRNITRPGGIIIAGWILGALAFLLLLSGMLFWQFDFRVRQQEVKIEGLPPAFEGFRIVQFSDVHLGSWGVKAQLQQAMDRMNELRPDVIFFTGDMFNYCTADGDGFEPILKTLHAPAGVFAIAGNHDYGDYITWPSEAAKSQNFEDMKIFYKELGWTLLLNSSTILHRGADSIAVTGVENWGATARFQRLGDLEKAQRGTETMKVRLLLSHDPSHWDSIVSKQYPEIDLTFAGHTHGGQVGIDCCGIHWSPVQWVSRLWSGLYETTTTDSRQYLYVNQGLGNIGYSGRIGILPEITVITLRQP